MLEKLPPDPSLKDLQLFWESQYWGKRSWEMMSRVYENWMKFFGADRKPRDIFRSDIAAYKIWLTKKGWSDTSIATECERLRRFYRLLNELELVEEGWNPATGMSPKRIRIGKK
jgi:site-specific recombinase XerD